jgi:hypothetical protein
MTEQELSPAEAEIERLAKEFSTQVTGMEGRSEVLEPPVTFTGTLQVQNHSAFVRLRATVGGPLAPPGYGLSNHRGFLPYRGFLDQILQYILFAPYSTVAVHVTFPPTILSHEIII